VSVPSPSTSAARSGFRAMDVSSCEVDRVAFGKRRAQGRSGNPSPQATCLGGCSAGRAVLECHESDQRLTDKGTPRGRAEVRPGGRGRRTAGATRGTPRRMLRGVQCPQRSDANGQRLCAVGRGMHECAGTRVVALTVLVLRGRQRQLSLRGEGTVTARVTVPMRVATKRPRSQERGRHSRLGC
jgi:hypothetical protein